MHCLTCGAEWGMSIRNATKAFRVMKMRISSLSVDRLFKTCSGPDWLSGATPSGVVHYRDGFTSQNPTDRCYRLGRCLDFLAGPSGSARHLRKRNLQRYDFLPSMANHSVTKPGSRQLLVVATSNRPCVRETECEFVSSIHDTKSACR